MGPLHDWYFNGDRPLVDEDHADVHGAPFRVSAAPADYVRGMWSRQKVLFIGRHQFDLTNGWEGHPAASDHVAIETVPVVFGRGKPYFGTLASGQLMLKDPDVVIKGDGVLHMRYPVRR